MMFSSKQGLGHEAGLKNRSQASSQSAMLYSLQKVPHQELYSDCSLLMAIKYWRVDGVHTHAATIHEFM
jgi:hypothetical protein